MCEALLHHGVSQKVKSSGKDLIRSQLAEVAGGAVSEHKVCTFLLDAPESSSSVPVYLSLDHILRYNSPTPPLQVLFSNHEG